MSSKLTPEQIKALRKLGYKVSKRRVSFEDLARAEYQVCKVTAPDGSSMTDVMFSSQEQRRQWRNTHSAALAIMEAS